MRIAALAFGVVAGLVASLILALGGLDVSTVAGSPDRQIQVTRFGLFVIANLGVFGAGLVLATPLGGSILFVIGALAWIIAGLVLHHGTDLVIIVPPALLLIATALSLVAFFSRGRRLAVPPLVLGRRRRPPQPEEDDEMAPVSVGAGYFGDGGTGRPIDPGEPSIGGLDGRDRPPLEWMPGKRRPPPPRQKPMFRPADDEIEESGFSRVARGTSSVLSFGLYGAIAAAALLVFWNLRSADTHTPAAAKLEPAAVSSIAEVAPAAPVLTQPAQDLAPAAPAAEAPQDQAPTISPQMLNGVVVADDPDPEVTFEPPDNVLAAGGDTQTGTLPQSGGADQAVVSSGPTPAADGSAVMPFPMPPQIAAQRTGPSSRPARTAAPAAPLNDTGL